MKLVRGSSVRGTWATPTKRASPHRSSRSPVTFWEKPVEVSVVMVVTTDRDVTFRSPMKGVKVESKSRSIRPGAEIDFSGQAMRFDFDPNGIQTRG